MYTVPQLLPTVSYGLLSGHNKAIIFVVDKLGRVSDPSKVFDRSSYSKLYKSCKTCFEFYLLISLFTFLSLDL